MIQGQRILENKCQINSKTYIFSEVLGRLKSSEAVDY